MTSFLTISDEERLALRLHNRRLKPAQIAREMGCHRRTAKLRVERAKAKLEEIRKFVKSGSEGTLAQLIEAV